MGPAAKVVPWLSSITSSAGKATLAPPSPLSINRRDIGFRFMPLLLDPPMNEGRARYEVEQELVEGPSVAREPLRQAGQDRVVERGLTPSGGEPIELANCAALDQPGLRDQGAELAGALELPHSGELAVPADRAP